MDRVPIKSFFVLTWDFNEKKVKYYDIMPLLFREWAGITKKTKPKSDEDVKNWILSESLYYWKSRCQYEIVITGFPEKEEYTEKIDIYSQIEANIDLITKLFIDCVNYGGL